mmetsp:Transcript_9489/g.22437  ORF Transcript_9489/g.22437 Transcript_9489/m.22437 type:complete len:230 (+) Transcript_9489:487-1176(+)
MDPCCPASSRSSCSRATSSFAEAFSMAKPRRSFSKSKATTCLLKKMSPKTQRFSGPFCSFRPRSCASPPSSRRPWFLAQYPGEGSFTFRPSFVKSQVVSSMTVPFAARTSSVVQRSPLLRTWEISSFIKVPVPGRSESFLSNSPTSPAWPSCLSSAAFTASCMPCKTWLISLAFATSCLTSALVGALKRSPGGPGGIPGLKGGAPPLPLSAGPKGIIIGPIIPPGKGPG